MSLIPFNQAVEQGCFDNDDFLKKMSKQIYDDMRIRGLMSLNLQFWLMLQPSYKQKFLRAVQKYHNYSEAVFNWLYKKTGYPVPKIEDVPDFIKIEMRVAKT